MTGAHRTLAPTLFLAGALACGPQAALAQGSAAEAEAEALATVTITSKRASATGLDLSLRETPQSITVVDSQRMQDQGLVEISQVREQVVGIQSSHGSALGTDGTAYIARGFAIQNYQVDGIARPTTLYGFAEETADMVAYDRVEIIRGSNGLMTGIGQPSATIDLIRKRPTARLAADLAAEAGAWNLHRVSADIGGPLTQDGRILARAAGAWQENGTFIDREHVDRHACTGWPRRI